MVTKKRRSKGASVDFSGVEAGGMVVPDGVYLAYPKEVEHTEAESSGNEMFAYKWKILGPKCKGSVVFDNMVLVPQALWRLKTLLELQGLEVPDGSMDLDPADLMGEELAVGIEITNEDYKGKQKPRITGFLAADDVPDSDVEEEEDTEEEEEEEDTPPKKKAKSSKKPAKEEEEEEEEAEEEETEEEEEEEEEEKPAKKASGKKPSAKGKVKVGAKVSFKDDKGKTVKGVITEIDGTTVKVEDRNEEEWELDVEDLEVV